MKSFRMSALLFVAIGALLYGALYYAAERLVYSEGHSNPFYKIATLRNADADWLILGASHAMPLDFADVNAWLERETGARIVNLAGPGTGPLYNRFVLEHFLRGHRAKALLYVADSFAFYSRTWNEDRFADAKLVRRTPFEPAIAGSLAGYAGREGVDPRAVLDYVSGFSKINNRERFQIDVWEGESQFGRVYRPSTSAVTKRIAYLYPEKTPPDRLQRYLAEFGALLDVADRAGMHAVVIKLPVPAQFASQLPDEAAFDAALAQMLAARKVMLHDLSSAVPEPKYYFDSDHLNRAGLERLFDAGLKSLLTGR